MGDQVQSSWIQANSPGAPVGMYCGVATPIMPNGHMQSREGGFQVFGLGDSPSAERPGLPDVDLGTLLVITAVPTTKLCAGGEGG